MPEFLEFRVLGAVRFLNAATLNQITDGLKVHSDVAELRKNGSGLWVVWNANGLEEHTVEFDHPPATPPLGSVPVTLTVSDGAGRFLPRNATFALPRDPDPTHADKAESLFQAVDIQLYPSPIGEISPGWVVIRAHVKNQATGAPLGGALMRVLRTVNAQTQVLARGMTDARGEAMVVVPGIPVATFNTGSGSPLATEIDAVVEAIFDPAAGAVTDPDSVESKSGLPSASSPQKLAARRELVIELAITVP